MSGVKNLTIRCMIYDCDGVLFDSLEANRKFYNDICSAAGRNQMTDEELRYAHVSTTKEAIHYLFRNHRGLEERALARLRKSDPGGYVAYLKMEPHLLETLEELGKRGILRAINTNRSSSMKAIVESFRLEPFFELVATAHDVKRPKPHPDSIELILKKFQLSNTEAVFIGDSEIDQQAARGAGVTFISYKNRELEADGFIEDHLEILEIL